MIYEFPAENSGTNVNLVIAFLKKVLLLSSKSSVKLVVLFYGYFQPENITNISFRNKQNESMLCLLIFNLAYTGCCVLPYFHLCQLIATFVHHKHEKISKHV